VKEDTSIAVATIDDLARRVDGLVFSMRLPEAIKELPMRLGKPLVLYGQPMPEVGPLPVPAIQIDAPTAGRLLGRHLVEAGRRRIVFVGYGKSRWSLDRRLAVEAGIAGRASLEVIDIEVQSMEAGVAVADDIARSGAYDAAVCYNDFLAIGLLHGLMTRGVRVPADIAVAGFDNIPVSCYVTPSLTTVDMRGEEVGRRAFDALHHAIVTGDRTAAVTMLDPCLMVRASTAPAERPASRPDLVATDA
jgi:LacI family transcriptional regulator